MHILVTNDDGVEAPGLLALTQAMRKVADKVTVLAPDRNWSASGHVKTLHRPLRVKETRLDDGSQAWASDGAPSDCVALAYMGFVPEKIDMVVSGINPNSNIGHDVTYSGTVTAAMEAAIWGIPGIAVSLDRPEKLTGEVDFSNAAEAARRVIKWLMARNDVPNDLILNVNVPYGPLSEMKGFRLTRQGLRIYHDELVRRLDPRGKPYFWIGGEAPTGVDEPGTDYGALANGYVSITPIHLDLTSRKVMEWMQSDGFEAGLQADS
ncbi:MAG: 5'/3'-nucleotidase SurE [Anaerolineaceae bacterium]|nr:5'/3'-nucleotidase SurE [Anaerolineaceae bacterium]